MVQLTIYYDFASPFCYAAVEIARHLCARREIQVEWKPFEVIDYLPARGAMPRNPAFVRRAEAAQARRLAESYGLPLRLRDRLLNSNLALCAVEYARDAGHAAGKGNGMAARLLAALFQAYYAEGFDISDSPVVLDVAAACGLPPALDQALATGRYKERVAASRAEAHAQGVVAVPTWLAGGYGVVGVPEFAALERMLETASAVATS